MKAEKSAEERVTSLRDLIRHRHNRYVGRLDFGILLLHSIPKLSYCLFHNRLKTCNWKDDVQRLLHIPGSCFVYIYSYICTDERIKSEVL